MPADADPLLRPYTLRHVTFREARIDDAVASRTAPAAIYDALHFARNF